MFRCIECNAVFNEKPDYCDCGNDTFENLYVQSVPPQPQMQPQQNQYYYTEPVASVAPPKKADIKQILSYVVFGICIVLSLFVWIFIGNGSSSGKSQANNTDIDQSNDSSIPGINQVWDSTPPKSQKQIGVKAPSAPKNSAILNSRMSTLSSEMRTYVVTLGQTFVASWARGSVVGDGTCEIEFRIDNEGRIIDKKILKPSNNTTMDDSIKLMLENVTNVTNPPGDYQGERIIMAFGIQNRAFKVYYPKY